MEKELLKSVMASLKSEQEIKLNFTANFNSLNGSYKVIKVSRGKGKGGSLCMELMNTATGTLLGSVMMPDKTGVNKEHRIGTPTSDIILNIEADGKLHGVMTESELPKAFPRNEEAGKEMRELLKPLVGRKTETRLVLKSEKAPEFNGTWIVKNAKLNPGRGGQVSVMLVNVDDPTNTRELWSYRHGAIIDEIEEIETVVSTETMASTEST